MSGESRRIDAYDFGTITIGGRIFRNDVIIYPDRITDWWRKQGHLVQVEDLTEILAAKPDVLLIGTGYYGSMRISNEAGRICSEKEVKLIARPTPDAWKLHNKLTDDDGTTVLTALHLTC
ncbi:MAG: hypothetical protein JSV33_12175 [bacterium]|nr:MAG: hypothetical protein JSV33_12175 [bacterium]